MDNSQRLFGTATATTRRRGGAATRARTRRATGNLDLAPVCPAGPTWHVLPFQETPTGVAPAASGLD